MVVKMSDWLLVLRFDTAELIRACQEPDVLESAALGVVLALKSASAVCERLTHM
jgi:hypothetical protein